ncbi:S41 family peptidase [Nibrella saemangeumensis]|uniref:S41 family peptidase n=1 Tax=Nibrella saemangeumensis TaxID=1084526 RepID=A0ABP8NC38_9BACT
MKAILNQSLIAAAVCAATFAQAQTAVRPTAEQLYQQGARFNSPAWAVPYRDTLSREQRLAGLAQVWSETKYNFAYFDKVPHLDWDSLYIAYIPKVLKTASTEQYYQTLEEMMAQLNDGHTWVIPPSVIRERRGKPGIQTALIEGKAMVVGLKDLNLTRLGIRPGLEITKVNGEDVHAYVNRAVRPYISSSTEQNRRMFSYDYAFLLGNKADSVRLTFDDGSGKSFTRTLPNRNTSQMNETSMGNRRDFDFRWYGDQVAYVSLTYFDDRSIVTKFDSIYPQLKKAKAVILDVRQNGGGNSANGWDILARFTNRDFPMGKWETREYKPAHRSWGHEKLGWTGDKYIYNITRKDSTDFISVPLVILAGAKTNSAAEDFLSAFVQMQRGLIVGEPTSGSTGNPLFVNLPGGGAAIICTKRDTFYNGTEWVGKGIQPNIPVSQTIKDLRSNKDTVLEHALQLVKNQLRAAK